MGDQRKLSGRPVLKEGKRSKKIDVRFTEDEYILIEELEKELGINKTELIRMRVLNNAGSLVVNAKSLLRELDHSGAEIGRIGNNINQLAKHANTLKLLGSVPSEVVGHFNLLMEEYLRVQQSQEIALRKIIRAMGK